MAYQFGWISPEGKFHAVTYEWKNTHGSVAREIVKENGWQAPEWDDQTFLMQRGYIRVDMFEVQPGPPTQAQLRVLLRLRVQNMRSGDRSAQRAIEKYLAQHGKTVKGFKMIDKGFYAQVEKAHEKLGLARRYTMTGWGGNGVPSDTDTAILIDDIVDVVNMLQAAFVRSTGGESDGVLAAGAKLKAIVSGLRIAQRKLQSNDWKGVPRLLRDASQQMYNLMMEIKVPYGTEGNRMKALTGDINAKIAEGSSYFRPIITFLQDGQRGAHVVYQDASRAFDLWNDVSEMLRDRGDAQLVKYVNRVLSPLARAKKYAEWAQVRNPGFDSFDNEKLPALIPEIKRAAAIAAVIARKAGAAKSRKSIKNDWMGGGQPKVPFRSMRSMKGRTQDEYGYRQLEASLEALGGMPSLLMSNNLDTDAARAILAQAIKPLVRVQRMWVNDSRFAHRTAMLREVITSLADAARLAATNTSDAAGQRKIRGLIVRKSGTAASILNGLLSGF